MIVGHIGARKGSKGVPGKNFRMLQGKPLIDWSLDQLLNNRRIDAVVVSTDDEQIYHHARAKNTVVSALAPQSFALIRRQNGQFGNIHGPLLKKNWSSFGLC